MQNAALFAVVINLNSRLDSAIFKFLLTLHFINQQTNDYYAYKDQPNIHKQPVHNLIPLMSSLEE